MSEKSFPILSTGGRIPWGVAELAYIGYSKRFGTDQTLERLAQRGGFATEELDEFAPGWRDCVTGLAQLRSDLARAEGERDKLLRDNKDFISAYAEIEQERDTLKAECERLREATQPAANLIGRLASEVDDLRAQLTQAGEARKLCAVQMMALEEEREKAVETAEANILASIADGGTSCHWCKDKTREEGHRQGMERAAEIVSGINIQYPEVASKHWAAGYEDFKRQAIDGIHAESSTLPRTYEQGAENMRAGAVKAVAQYLGPNRGLQLLDAIRALPTKEG